jgi:predicted ATPase
MVSDSFGGFLRNLRKRAAMTQGDLAAATGYSVSFISSLECGARRPDILQVTQHFVPALGLQDEPRLAASLIELAVSARGEKLPPSPQSTSPHPTAFPAKEDDRGGSLPRPPTEMIGRDDEVKLLCNRLLGHSGRLLTLTGPVGVGKTRLALEVAHRLEPLLRDGVRFIPLATLRDAVQLATNICAALELSASATKSPDAQLIGHLRRKQMLLVLDNFEQLLAGANATAEPVSAQNPATALVAALLCECPELQIIVTSRARLHLRTEQRHKVAPLELDPAVALFIQRAQLQESAADLIETDHSLLRTICQELDCLPLAIELCAAHLDLLAPDALLSQLREHRLDVLVDGALDLPPTQRTLRAAIQGSYSLLTPMEQTLFCDLGVFVGSFDQAAFNALHHASVLLEALLSKSMLTVVSHGGKTRFALLETLREFALEQLAHSDREEAVRRSHATYYGELARSAARHMKESAKTDWLDRLEKENDNLRAALQWMLDKEPARALRLVVDLEEFWRLRGDGREAERGLRAALDGNAQPTLLRAWALLALAALRRRGGQYYLAASGLQEAEQILNSGENPVAEAGNGFPPDGSADIPDIIDVRLKYYHCAGWYYYDLHDYQSTLANFLWGLALARERGDSSRIVRFLTALVHIQRDRLDQRTTVAGYLDECLLRLQHLDDPEALAFVMQQYGALETAAEQYAAAADYYRRIVAIFRPLRDKAGLAWALELLAENAWFQGDLALAQQHYAEAYALFVELDNPDGVMITLHHLAQVARRTGRCDEAQAHYCRSLRRAVALKNPHMTARNLAGLGAIAMTCARHEDAALLLSAAKQQFAALPLFLAPFDQREFTSQTDTMQKMITTPSITAAWEIGQTTPPEQVALATLLKLGS